MSGRSWIATGAYAAAVAIGAGAFGAHALRARLDAHALGLWETAARYAMYAALALIAIGLTRRGSEVPPSRALVVAPWCLSIGAAIFTSTLAALALGAPRFWGAITPLGGLLMISGLVLFGLAARKR